MKTSILFLILMSLNALAQTQGAAATATGGKKATAAPMSVNTGAANSANFQSVVFAGQAARGMAGKVNFVIKNTCFGTNLRSVQNPLSPMATIQLQLGIQDFSGKTKNYTISYPAAAVTSAGVGQVMELDPSLISDPNEVSGALVGNVLRFKTGLSSVASVSDAGVMSYVRSGSITAVGFGQTFIEKKEDGQPPFPLYGAFSSKLCTSCGSESGATEYLKRALPFRNAVEANTYFAKYPLRTGHVNDMAAYNESYQLWYRWFLPAMLTLRAKDHPGPYMGLPGPLSAHLNIFNSKDGKTIEIVAAFPGQEGYCGGYHSPLMIFFDNKRPKFTANVDFPINDSGKTMWPEAGSPGYFIAYDRVEDGLITRGDEIFGNSKEHENGFEAFREFDSNKDDVVDAKDEKFAKLLLWQDANGDGFSQPGELSPLKEKVKSVSLKYNNKETNSFGRRAEVRERSLFTYMDNGKEKTGDVLDIWFSPSK